MPKKENAADKALNDALKNKNGKDLTPAAEAAEPVAPAKAKKKSKVKVYFAKFYLFSFCYNTFRPDGKAAYVTNRTTGLPLTDGDGMPRPVTKMEAFDTKVTKMSKGYLSQITHDFADESPNNVSRGEALERLAAKESLAMYSQDEYEKLVNNPMWVEKQGREDAETRAALAEAATAELQKKLDNLKKD